MCLRWLSNGLDCWWVKQKLKVIRLLFKRKVLRFILVNVSLLQVT